MEGAMLTPQQVSKRLTASMNQGISEWRVRRWCNERKLPGAQLFGRSWLIPESDVVDVEALAARIAPESRRHRFGDLLPAGSTLDLLNSDSEGEGA